MPQAEEIGIATVFKYISCYCLTKSNLLTLHKKKYLNTSHVTV
ncbi:hypothetical protein HMPREF0220_1457 [Clostridioides difficile NAP08]|uniref:Uncharacterized protein n=1 Tax=Clostridioides difficile NAP08 TaxID=525259 RepID=D5Q3H5_CLODI|nr:hypothetical protein HMPREF0220_1457 [Clostridioides difficile NAP08]EFH15419.1 hypothetical protein HMPREF0219_1937 [Clostridioides difficile NAP07]